MMINKKSVGTVWINGRPYSYNLNQMGTVDFDRFKPRRKRKVIVVRKK